MIYPVMIPQFRPFAIPQYHPVGRSGTSGIFDAAGSAVGEMLGGAAITMLAIGAGLALGYWGAKLTTRAKRH